MSKHLGEFVNEQRGTPSLARRGARIQFLIALARYAPQAMESLRDLSAEEWVERWNLGRAPWIGRQARITKKSWKNAPELADAFDWGLFEGIANWEYNPPPFELTFTGDGWNPQKETVGVWKGRTLKAIERRLHPGIDLRDWTKAPAPRDFERDLRWLVLYQVLGNRCAEIARDEIEVASAEPHVDPARVRRAIERCAERIGFALRVDGRSGRPRRG